MKRGNMIDINLLNQMADLLRFRHDPPILSALDKRPFRFRELHARLETCIGEHVDDNALTRGLGRLTRSGLVHVESEVVGIRCFKTYDLSDVGCRRLRHVEGLLAAYAHTLVPITACDGACFLHNEQRTGGLEQLPVRSTEIDIDALVRMADRLKFRHDPPILAALSARPRRFRELHVRLEASLGEHVDDNTLTRGLGRLTRSGLIHVESTLKGLRDFKTYSLSDRGRERLREVEGLLAVYAHLLSPADECDGGCYQHRMHDVECAA
jgi:DNA-binding HxlR family transcriptional regulator